MAELYEALYRLGYGSDGLMVHYAPVLKTVAPLVAEGAVRTVLDVGSSHGGGVSALWTMGARASGVDVSPTAVAMARDRHGDNASQCVEPCWSAAPATALPFADGAFDALMSTDVLEHLQEEDVEAAVRELARVTRAWMFLKISNRHESVRMNRTRTAFSNETCLRCTYTEAARVRFGVDVPKHLHAAVHPERWWVQRFARAGFVHNATIPVPGWACCAFVLRSASAFT